MIIHAIYARGQKCGQKIAKVNIRSVEAIDTSYCFFGIRFGFVGGCRTIPGVVVEIQAVIS